MTELFRDLAAAPESHALTRGLWARRAMITLMLAVAVAALLGAFGQVTSTSTATGAAATLSVDAPKAVRGGLFFQSRVDIRATRDIEHPRLVLANGWVEGMQFNSMEPSAVGEASRDGRLVLSYDKLAAGDRLTIWMQFEVDPTSTGRRSYDLALEDATTPVASVRRTITVLP
jgi:hypothetical protein